VIFLFFLYSAILQPSCKKKFLPLQRDEEESLHILYLVGNITNVVNGILASPSSLKNAMFYPREVSGR
jgi:hypothetical protein